MFDLVVGGGWLLDGTGAPAYRADVAVAGGRIAAVGRLDQAVAAARIDATGRYVAPGFVDAHVHGDAAVLDPAVQLAALRQGVTTFLLGQDGLSYAPATPAARAYVTRYFEAVNGPHPALPDGPVGVADLLATYDRTTALNTAYLVPHGTVRYCVLGGAGRPSTAEERAAMVRLVEQGLDQGAAGLSSGLEYLPGRHADAAELAAVCAPVAARGLPYVTHMRGYENAAAAGMAEATAVARAAGVAAHVSHYHGPGPALAGLVDDARAAGLDVTFDSYPYRRGCSILAMIGVPAELQHGDLDRTVEALGDPAVRRRMREGRDPGLWHRITLSYVPAAELAWAEGMRLADAAASVGLAPADFCAELLVGTRLAAGAVFEFPPLGGDAAGGDAAGEDAAGEDSVGLLLRHPAHMGGSDGIYRGGHPHPRGWGAFARLLGRHVRERGDWTWEQAAVHLAAHPARRFGLADRGLIRPGLAADLVVFDPATVIDRAGYDAPRELATGVDDVVVNGVPVLAGGQLTGARPGTPLRPR
ncbi:MAG TPA: amidohydrolase family protein [Pilimelia sp.]|nr:amidohydrolase family protein [Pilimelia sp.]